MSFRSRLLVHRSEHAPEQLTPAARLDWYLARHYGPDETEWPDEVFAWHPRIITAAGNASLQQWQASMVERGWELAMQPNATHEGPRFRYRRCRP